MAKEEHDSNRKPRIGRDGPVGSYVARWRRVLAAALLTATCGGTSAATSVFHIQADGTVTHDGVVGDGECTSIVTLDVDGVLGDAVAIGHEVVVTWPEHATRVPGQALGMEAGDLDGDGRDELVVVLLDSIEVWQFDEELQPTRTSSASRAADPGPAAIAIADFDGDGSPEVVLGQHGKPVELWQSDDEGLTRGGTQPEGPIVVLQPHAIAAGDLNQDGLVDVAAPTLGGARVWFGSTDGLEPAWEIDASDVTQAVVADVDGDGLLDLLAAGVDGSTLWFGEGEAQPSERREFPGASAPVVVVGDESSFIVSVSSDGLLATDLGGMTSVWSEAPTGQIVDLVSDQGEVRVASWLPSEGCR